MNSNGRFPEQALCRTHIVSVHDIFFTVIGVM